MDLSHMKGSMPTTSSITARKASEMVSDQFPAGLRVLVVDDDPTCLRILEKMLQTCCYAVTKCNRAEIALSMLRENKNGFDIVLSDVHMPDMDGFKLLEHIGLEMDLPVIMMSADDGKNVVMKGVVHGACDYLIKPVRIEALRNIWQHVVRKRKTEWKDLEQSGSVEDGDREQKPFEGANYSSSANEGSWNSSKRRRDVEEEPEERDDSSTLKKPRVVWSVELHQQFVAAVNQLGIDKAVPKKILELMNVPGLTRENVASHLQKYRLYLRRLSGVSPHQSNLNNSFIPQEATFGSMASFGGLDLQTLSVTSQLSPQSLAALQAAGLSRSTAKSGISMALVDQKNIFSFENPKLRFDEQAQQLNGSKPVNLFHGIPTAMEPKQLANMHPSAQTHGNINMQLNVKSEQGGTQLLHMAQQQAGGQILNNTTGNHLHRIPSTIRQPIISSGIMGRNGTAHNSQGPGYNLIPPASLMMNFPINQTIELSNNFPLPSNSSVSTVTSKGAFQEEISSDLKESGGLMSSYDVFNDLHQQKSQDWDSQNVSLAFGASQHGNFIQDSLDVSPSTLVHHGFSSSQTNVQSQNTSVIEKAVFSFSEATEHENAHSNVQNSLLVNSVKVKTQRIPDESHQTGPLPENFGQDELLSALLKQQQGDNGSVESEFDFSGYHTDNICV